MNIAEPTTSLDKAVIALIRSKRWNEALEKINQALLQNLDDSTKAYIWNLKGIVYCSMKHYTEALESCDEAIKLASSDGLPWYFKGRILSKANPGENHSEIANAFYKAFSLPWNISQPVKKFHWHMYWFMFKFFKYAVTDTTLNQ